jgi:hypothetical protein
MVKNLQKKASFVFKQILIEEDIASQHLITTKKTQIETICSKLQTKREKKRNLIETRGKH